MVDRCKGTTTDKPDAKAQGAMVRQGQNACYAQAITETTICQQVSNPAAPPYFLRSECILSLMYSSSNPRISSKHTETQASRAPTDAPTARATS